MPDTIAPYGLRVPKDSELANVPGDLTTLAQDVTAALNGKMSKTAVGGTPGADDLYQTKIEIVTSLPPTTAGYAEGAIVFVVP